MTKKQIFIGIIILVVGISAGIFGILAFRPPVDITPYEHEVKLLKTLIDTNNARDLRLNNKVIYWEAHSKNQDTIIDTQQTKIERLTKDETKKIKAVDNMSSNDLSKSISDRYK